MSKILYDKDIREPLFDFLEVRYGKTRILEEKNIGISRADQRGQNLKRTTRIISTLRI